MSPIAITLLIASVLCVLYIIVIYNRLVNLQHNAGMACSNIDMLLKQRHNELPKLGGICRQYMLRYEHESRTGE